MMLVCASLLTHDTVRSLLSRLYNVHVWERSCFPATSITLDDACVWTLLLTWCWWPKHETWYGKNSWGAEIQLRYECQPVFFFFFVWVYMLCCVLLYVSGVLSWSRTRPTSDQSVQEGILVKEVCQSCLSLIQKVKISQLREGRSKHFVMGGGGCLLVFVICRPIAVDV